MSSVIKEAIMSEMTAGGCPVMLPPTATKARIKAVTLAVCEVSELDMFYGPLSRLPWRGV
jgi:hypothetical protein